MLKKKQEKNMREGEPIHYDFPCKDPQDLYMDMCHHAIDCSRHPTPTSPPSKLGTYYNPWQGSLHPLSSLQFLRIPMWEAIMYKLSLSHGSFFSLFEHSFDFLDTLSSCSRGQTSHFSHQCYAVVKPRGLFDMSIPDRMGGGITNRN